MLLLLWWLLMPAPTNISFATATDIGTTLPYTTTQTVDFSGTTYTVWYKYTAQTGDTEISVFPFGDLVTYQPNVTFWTDASTQYLFNDAQNRPSQIPVTPGTTYAFKIAPNGGNPSPANLSLTVKLGPTDQLSAGMLAINDSTAGYPAVIMDPSTAAPVAFKHPFASGEGVCVTTSGIICAIDVASNGVILYNPNFSVRSTPTMPASGYTECLGTNQIDTFWVGKQGAGATHGSMVSVTTAGVVGTAIDGGAVGMRTLAPNSGNTKVYFARNITSTNQPVLVVNTSSLVVTTFLAGVVGKYFGANLLMMTDNTLLVPYEAAGVDTIIRRYNEAGVQQGSDITLTGVQEALERIFADPSDPTYFWVWWQTSTQNRFQKIKVSDGSVITDLTNTKFIEGDSQAAASATPTTYFGADFSCVPWILRGVTPSTTYPTRRLRRFLLPSSENNFQMFLSKLELLMETGVGLTAGPTVSPVQGEDPQVMLRLSKDGGVTWGNEQWRSAGAIGEYLTRVRWLRQGKYRNAVCEITVSDPVRWRLIAMIAELAEGSS